MSPENLAPEARQDEEKKVDEEAVPTTTTTPTAVPVSAEKQQHLPNAPAKTTENTDPKHTQNNASSNSNEKLRTVRGTVPPQVYLISTVLFLERASFYGVTAPFQNYVQNPPRNSVRPGALGLGQPVAVAVSYAFLYFQYLTPVFGAVAADCWVGRYRMILVGLGLDILAFSILSGTAFSQELNGRGGLPGFIVAIVLLGLGVGATKPNLLAFLADQYTDEEGKILTLGSGEKVVTSRDETVQFIYNLSYWMTNLGGLAGLFTTFVEKNAGFRYAFLFSLGAACIAAAVLLAGGKRYVMAPPSGNVLPKAFKALLSRETVPVNQEVEEAEETQQQTQQTITPAELKAVFKSCWVFIPFPALVLSIDQSSNNLLAQAAQMQTHSLPNDLMFALNPLSVMLLLPLIQTFLVPFLSKRRIPFTPYHRICAGLFCAAVALAYTAGLQSLIYAAPPCYAHPLACNAGNGDGNVVGPNDVNVGLQTPVYIFLALAEILALVAATELAYTQTPKSMKSIVQAVFILFGSLGSVLGVGVGFASRDPWMVAVYAAVSGFMGAVAVGFTGVVVRVLARKRREKAAAGRGGVGLVDG